MAGNASQLARRVSYDSLGKCHRYQDRTIPFRSNLQGKNGEVVHTSRIDKVAARAVAMAQFDLSSDVDDDMGAETYMQDISSWMTAFLEDWNIKLCLSTVIAFFASVFGEDWWLIECLFFLLVADCALGIGSALHFNGKLSSRRLHDGVVKFAAYAVSIILVWLVQEICRRTIPVPLPVLAVYAGYQSLTEIKSVARHLERLGLKMPKLFHRVTSGAEEKVEEKIDQILPDVPDTKDGKIDETE